MKITRALAAALALATMAGVAQAQEPLTVTGYGENFAVRYADDYTGNIVGGGYAHFVNQGQETQIAYANPHLGRHSPGIPVDLGGDEDVAYLPQPAAPTRLATR